MKTDPTTQQPRRRTPRSDPNGFTRVPNKLIYTKVKPAQFRLLVTLSSFFWKDETQARVSEQSLAAVCGFTDRYVRKLVDDLKEKGLLKVSGGQGAWLTFERPFKDELRNESSDDVGTAVPNSKPTSERKFRIDRNISSDLLRGKESVKTLGNNQDDTIGASDEALHGDEQSWAIPDFGLGTPGPKSSELSEEDLDPFSRPSQPQDDGDPNDANYCPF